MIRSVKTSRSSPRSSSKRFEQVDEEGVVGQAVQPLVPHPALTGQDQELPLRIELGQARQDVQDVLVPTTGGQEGQDDHVGEAATAQQTGQLVIGRADTVVAFEVGEGLDLGNQGDVDGRVDQVRRARRLDTDGAGEKPFADLGGTSRV
jgi:hypothetical protein